MVAGALPVLVTMLQSPQQSVQEAALGAIGAMTCDAVMSAGRIMQLMGWLYQCGLALAQYIERQCDLHWRQALSATNCHLLMDRCHDAPCALAQLT